MVHANALLLTAAAAALLLPGCGSREEKYPEAQAPVGVSEALSVAIPHFVAESDKICCLIVLRNSGTAPLQVPLKPNNAADPTNAFLITVPDGKAEHRHFASKITNNLPTGYNKWAHAVGNFNTAKNLGQTATSGIAVVPPQGQTQVELTFTIDPDMPSKKSPWVLTVQHVKDDKNKELSVSVSIK